MSSTYKDISTVDNESFPYTFAQNVSIPLKSSSGVVRCNVYLPKVKDDKGEAKTFPALVTYGPYGKDISYEDFHPQSFSEVNPEHHSAHSAWETPDPGYWTAHGYVIVRVDERGLGQSPGLLDTMSRGTSEAFFDAVEWASEQPWSSGKVGLLGISYFAGSQWRVAALQPKGLSAIIPWEGMSDYYRDRCRHGGILSNEFIRFWWTRQVLSNQYGKGGRKARNWGPDTIEGDLTEEELERNRNDQTIDNVKNSFRDEPYYSSKEYSLEDIKVPLLSVANWGGILLHLRGNVEGYTHAGSDLKYLRFVCGRHDLPFYYHEEVELQRSFMDAFLLGDDRVGWSTPGKVPAVDLVLRKGDVGFDNPTAEKAFSRRTETAWPIPRTQYTNYYLTPDRLLSTAKPEAKSLTKLSYEALGTPENFQWKPVQSGWKQEGPPPTKLPHEEFASLENGRLIQFQTAAVEEETEITGHVVAHLNVSMHGKVGKNLPSNIDLFLTLRHFSPLGKEVFYTGTAGDGVPLCKGWLRVSLRKVNNEHIRHRPWLPRRDYLTTDVLPVIPGEVYPVDIEIWPTNVILEKGAKLVLEVASGDTQGSGIFKHTDSTDRTEKTLNGINSIHFGPLYENYITLPIIPQN